LHKKSGCEFVFGLWWDVTPELNDITLHPYRSASVTGSSLGRVGATSKV
jgi:hypothetical protein